jgi:hypothetical protein
LTSGRDSLTWKTDQHQFERGLDLALSGGTNPIRGRDVFGFHGSRFIRVASQLGAADDANENTYARVGRLNSVLATLVGVPPCGCAA